MKKFVLLLLTAVLVVATSSGASEYIYHEGASGEITSDCKLNVKFMAGNYNAVGVRTFQYWMSYGVLGDTLTNTVAISDVYTVSRSTSKWFGDDETGYTTDVIPGFTWGKTVWFDVVISNMTFNGAAVTSSNTLTTDMGLKMLVTAFSEVDDTWTISNKMFKVFGTMQTSLNWQSVTLTYALNADSLGSGAQTKTVVPESDGSFSFSVPFTDLGTILLWKLTAIDEDGLEYTYVNGDSETESTTKHRDQGRVTYTWTGNGDGTSWTDIDNWSPSTQQCHGYPGTLGAWGYYWSQLAITESMAGQVIDMEGGAYVGRDDGEALTVAADIPCEVKFKNGSWGFEESPWVLGASGTTLVFEGVDFNYKPDNNAVVSLYFATGSTTVFEGTTSATKWYYKPSTSYANTKMIVRNGTLTMSQNLNSSSLGQHSAWITNAIWQVNSHAASGIAGKTYFRDGVDRQAQFICSSSLKMNNTYDIEIPASGHSQPSIKAATLSNDNEACTIKVDVSAIAKTTTVPLVKFTSSTAQTTAATNKLAHATLAAYANGKNVTKARNAQLIWSADDNTIYYEQEYTEGVKLILR